MSDITVKCSRCGKRHGLETYNARVQGTVIRVFCPFCRKETVRNISKFAETQLPPVGRVLDRFELCSKMTALARKIEKEFN